VFCRPGPRFKLIRATPQATTKNSVTSTCRSAGTKGISLSNAI